MKENKKIIKGRGKIHFHHEKDREKMEKKYPNIEFEKMNPLTFTTTYKGNEQFEVEIKVGDTKIPCSFKKWAWPWKYGTNVELRLHFKDLKKKVITHITGGIQGKLFKLYRYDYEKMMKDKKKGGAMCWPCLFATIPKKKKEKRGGGKRTFKKEQKKENKEYYNSVKKCRKMKDKTEKDRNKKGNCYLPLDKNRYKILQYLEKEYPKEWLEFKNRKGGMNGNSFHNATRLEGSWLYDWKPYK